MELTLASRSSFVRDVTAAVIERRPFAAGKIGTSEKHWMYYPLLLERRPSPRQTIAFEAALAHHCRSSGIFPAGRETYLAFNRFYIDHVRNLDSLGLFRDMLTIEDAVVSGYGLADKAIHYLHQEPDRSPAGDECYLPSFQGRKLLLICPFARLLQARANRTTFETVWSKLRKPWFAPASVEALEFPYGFSADTQQRFPSVERLYDDIAARMDAIDFDVALIAAAALGIPLASHAKQTGRVGLSLGGHLQVLFGVRGKRWSERPDWRAQYFTEGWIDMPAALRPDGHEVCDDGAYW